MPGEFDYFPLYVHRLLSSRSVRLMNATEFGGYMFLLIESFISEPQGYLPDDPSQLRVLARMSDEEWAQYGENLTKKFQKRQKGLIFNPTMVQVISDLKKKREKHSSNGRKGASVRWRKDGEANGDAIARPMAKPSVCYSIESNQIKSKSIHSPAIARPSETLEEHVLGILRMTIVDFDDQPEDVRAAYIKKEVEKRRHLEAR